MRLVKSFSSILLVIIAAIILQSCNGDDCDKTFVKKYKIRQGYAFQSDSLTINLKNNNSDTLTVYAFKTNNRSFKLVYSSVSDYVHFHPLYNKNKGDSLLIVFYGSVLKDTIKRQAYFFEKKGKFIESETFIIDLAIAKDIVANKSNNVVNFALGNYKFDLSNEMACMLKQITSAEL